MDDCVYQVFVLRMIDDAIRAVKSLWCYFRSVLMLRAWCTAFLTGSLVSTFLTCLADLWYPLFDFTVQRRIVTDVLL